MAGRAEQAPPLRFTTRDVAAPARRRALYELREQGLLPLEPLPGCSPRVDLCKWRLPGASVLSGTFAGVRQGGEPAGAVDDLSFGINVSGASLARCRGHEITVGAGDALAVDPDAGAFSVVRPEPARLIGVRVSRRRVPLDSAGFGAIPMRLVPAGTVSLRLLTGYLRSALSSPALSSASLAETVVSHVTELIALSLEQGRIAILPDGDASVRAARLTAIKVDIDRHLTDGSLTVAALAARHGISTRYLHKLFEDETSTYSQFVLDRRLALAYRRLRHPRFATRTISSIAHDTGFGDLSYFNRTFRCRYGITPSDARRHTAVSITGVTFPPPAPSYQ